MHDRPIGGRIFDAHMHIIDPRYPLVANDGYLPNEFTTQDYLTRVANLPVVAGTVVSGSFQGFDQTYLIDALQELGPSFVGVTQISADCSDDEIVDLASHNVRGVRFNVRRGGSAQVHDLDRLARRAYDLAGWHSEIYIDSTDLPVLETVLSRLPALSIDHLGLSDGGMNTLLRLVDAGAYVKATGFGRLTFDPKNAIRQIMAVNPHALIFGTDLPSTRADRPFDDADVMLLCEAVGEEFVDDVLWANAARLYRVAWKPSATSS
jgi:predicted TIM-barrel fold metal-dependent hydrolase